MAESAVTRIVSPPMKRLLPTGKQQITWTVTETGDVEDGADCGEFSISDVPSGSAVVLHEAVLVTNGSGASIAATIQPRLTLASTSGADADGWDKLARPTAAAVHRITGGRIPHKRAETVTLYGRSYPDAQLDTDGKIMHRITVEIG